jgi:hypothetical protein
MTAHLLGSGTERSQGRLGGFRKFNYAPTLAEAVSIAAGGVPESLRGASNVNRILSAFANGAGANAYTAFSGASLSGFSASSDGSGDHRASTGDDVVIVAGFRYRFELDLVVNSGVVGSVGVRSTVSSGTIQAVALTPSTGKITLDFVARLSDTVQLYARNINQAGDFVISNAKFERIGLTSQLSPESIQLAPGQWLDTSGNGKHAYIPDGFRLGAASRSGDLSSVLTWEASSTDPRYVTGVNASAVPANGAITIYARATASGTFNIGDGSNATYYASAVSIGTTWTPITLTSPVNDGTNRKIVLTPTSAYAGSVTISAQVQVLT